MRKPLGILLGIFLATQLFAAQRKARRVNAAPAAVPAAEPGPPGQAQLEQMAARFTPTPLRADVGSLSAGDLRALPKLLEAARILNDVFLDQQWGGNRALWQRLRQDATPTGRARLHYFWINKGPWDELNGDRAFLPDVPPRKPYGANFYPEDMTRAEFERWLATLSPVDQDRATGFYTVIRRGPEARLTMAPYSEAYRADLTRAAQLLRESAALTENASLRTFLQLRADAFLSNDYYASEIAWMNLDAPLEVTLGPYETYRDELFGYKAAFEAYIGVRDDRETAKLLAFARNLQEIENHLPIDPRYRNPRLPAAAPIRVVNEIYCSGDGAHGVQTAAYNLPNDERVVKETGSKRVMLRNVQEAKFRAVLVPIATRVLDKRAQPDVSFNMFFSHILAHELMHGLGPHQIVVDGRSTNVRRELKDTYSAIEEAKADISSLFALQYMMDHAASMKLGSVLPADEAAQRQLYVTYLASAFRTLRFGLGDAHGKGMAVQFNSLIDQGAIVERPNGSFTIDLEKMKIAVRDLTRELLTLEATGNYAGARRLLNTHGVIRPNVRRALDRLTDVPVDIEPVFTTVRELEDSGNAPSSEPGAK